MLWSEVKKYAKNNGYETLKEEDGYYWSKIDNPAMSGVSKSVSKLAKDIYNQITNGDFIDHQILFEKNKQIIIKADLF